MHRTFCGRAAAASGKRLRRLPEGQRALTVGVWLALGQALVVPLALEFAHPKHDMREPPMSQLISSLMRRTITSVAMDDTVAQVEALLASKRMTWVPVLERSRGEAVGVISAWDIVNFHAQKRNAATTQAWQMCSYKPIVVDIETPVALVASLMVERGIHHVVVTDCNGLAGVASSLDFVRTFLPESLQSDGRP